MSRDGGRMSETSGLWQAMEDSRRCEFKYRRDVLVREYQMQKVTVNVIRRARFRFSLRKIVFSKRIYYILAKMARSRLSAFVCNTHDGDQPG